MGSDQYPLVLADIARSNGLDLAEIIDMPANNMLLVWRRGQSLSGSN